MLGEADGEVAVGLAGVATRGRAGLGRRWRVSASASWPSLPRDAPQPAASSGRQDGGRDERPQTAETSSSSATRKEEPQPHAAITLGFSTLKPAPCRPST